MAYELGQRFISNLSSKVCQIVEVTPSGYVLKWDGNDQEYPMAPESLDSMVNSGVLDELDAPTGQEESADD